MKVSKKLYSKHMDVEDRSVVKKLIRRGQSVEVIAAAFGVSFWTVYTISKNVHAKNDQAQS